MGGIPEEVIIPQQETRLYKNAQLCVGQTSWKVPYNTVTGVTVLMTQSMTHTVPSRLHIKVRHTHMHTTWHLDCFKWLQCIYLLMLNLVDKRSTEEQPKRSVNYKYSPASTSAIPALTCIVFYVELKP